MNKARYQVQGPFTRRNQPQYWLVMDTRRKFVVAQHTRKGDAVSQATTLERIKSEMRQANERP
jgi:hypothetical protein